MPTSLDTHARASASGFTEAWEAFFRASRRMSGRSARPDPGGLTLSQFQLLEPLASGESLPVGTLAENAGVSGPTATRMLTGLARGGQVERARDTVDRRVVLVSLTANGEHSLRAKRAEVEATRRRIAASLEADERERAAELLWRLAEVMEERS